MLVERLVVSEPQSKGSREVVEEAHLVLRIGSESIHVLVDIARRGREEILPPVGTEDGCGMGREAEDGLEFTLHQALFLRLHIVADGIGLRLDIVLLAVAEAVDSEVGLQRVAAGELVDAPQAPSETLVAHLVVGAAGNVGTRLGPVGEFVGIVDRGIQRQFPVGRISEFLSYDVGAVASEQRCDGGLSLRIRAFHIFQAAVLVTVFLVVRERGVGAEAMGVDIEIDRLGELAMTRDTGIGGDTHQILRGLVGDDVDDTSDGIAAIERRGRPIEHLDALHARHVDAVEIDIVGNVARQFLPVDQDEDILVAQSVEAQEGAHRRGGHRHLWHHALYGVVEGGDALLMDFAAAEHMHGSGGGLEPLVVARARDHYRVEVISAPQR